MSAPKSATDAMASSTAGGSVAASSCANVRLVLKMASNSVPSAIASSRCQKRRDRFIMCLLKVPVDLLTCTILFGTLDDTGKDFMNFLRLFCRNLTAAVQNTSLWAILIKSGNDYATQFRLGYCKLHKSAAGGAGD